MALGLRAAFTKGQQPWFNDFRLTATDNADSAVKGPGLIADFRGNRFAITNVATGSISGATAREVANIGPAAFSDLFTFTRAGSGTYIDSTGTMQTATTDVVRYDWTNGVRQLLLEGAATNLFLNSATGSTQSVTVTAVQHVLSMYGTGSITLSGTGSGTLNGTGANNRVSLTFTPTAGSLTLTVSGSCTLVQLETGAVASSYIATAGTAVTRPTDSCQLSAKALAVLARTAAGVVVQGQGIAGNPSAGTRLVGGASSRVLGFTANNAQGVVGHSTTILTFATPTNPTPAFGMAGAWDGSGKAGSYNGSAIATNAAVMDATLSSGFLGRDSAGSPSNGWYDRFIIYPFRPTNASIVAEATGYV